MTKTLVAFIQDRSGSMNTIWEETVNGFKVFVEQLQADQKKDDQVEYSFAFTAWDTLIDTLPVSKITDVPTDLLTQYPPRGGTALYDAVGKTLVAIDEESKNVDKVLVVIVTDGEENSSREWSKDALHAAIDERIKRGNWTFTYLGTQPETWDEASSIGVGVGASVNYVGANAGATYSTVAFAASNLTRSRSLSSRKLFDDEAFTPNQMKAAANMKTATDAGKASTTVPSSTPFRRPAPRVYKPSNASKNRNWRTTK